MKPVEVLVIPAAATAAETVISNTSVPHEDLVQVLQTPGWPRDLAQKPLQAVHLLPALYGQPHADKGVRNAFLMDQLGIQQPMCGTHWAFRVGAGGTPVDVDISPEDFASKVHGVDLERDVGTLRMHEEDAGGAPDDDPSMADLSSEHSSTAGDSVGVCFLCNKAASKTRRPFEISLFPQNIAGQLCRACEGPFVALADVNWRATFNNEMGFWALVVVQAAGGTLVREVFSDPGLMFQWLAQLQVQPGTKVMVGPLVYFADDEEHDNALWDRLFSKWKDSLPTPEAPRDLVEITPCGYGCELCLNRDECLHTLRFFPDIEVGDWITSKLPAGQRIYAKSTVALRDLIARHMEQELAQRLETIIRLSTVDPQLGETLQSLPGKLSGIISAVLPPP